MIAKNRVLAVAALLIGLLLPAQLLAAWTAITRADLNLRVGPDTLYGIIDVIPAGEPVNVIGCIERFEWCDVEWLGLRGFVSAHYLVQPGTRVYLPQVAPSIGVPIIGFSFGTYHDRHYRDRSWYRERHWGGRWRDRRRHRVEEPRRRHRVEERRRDRRRDVLRERRPRVEQRQERRVKQRQERRVKQRQERRVEKRQERRVQKRQERRAEKRQERRAEKRQERRAKKRQERRRSGQRSRRGRSSQYENIESPSGRRGR